MCGYLCGVVSLDERCLGMPSCCVILGWADGMYRKIKTLRFMRWAGKDGPWPEGMGNQEMKSLHELGLPIRHYRYGIGRYKPGHCWLVSSVSEI